MTLISCSDIPTSSKSEYSYHLDDTPKALDAGLQSWPSISPLPATHNVTRKDVCYQQSNSEDSYMTFRQAKNVWGDVLNHHNTDFNVERMPL
ncbi:hypothetical protein PGIGA_G00148390 [Pangasianodon gigas]|uniref:Uncharacterized protein n=1 Tax=Pangasianodon gigas TaxID=30993 RepID=A0ACC5XPE4_PANGG|nr:hypothetical protein [Pangasianodon gigas]